MLASLMLALCLLSLRARTRSKNRTFPAWIESPGSCLSCRPRFEYCAWYLRVRLQLSKSPCDQASPTIDWRRAISRSSFASSSLFLPSLVWPHSHLRKASSRRAIRQKAEGIRRSCCWPATRALPSQVAGSAKRARSAKGGVTIAVTTRMDMVFPVSHLCTGALRLERPIAGRTTPPSSIHSSSPPCPDRAWRLACHIRGR